jgi:putative component of membrane protein insertase Oxa1/YidC/SpoIIIJ protein YidD
MNIKVTVFWVVAYKMGSSRFLENICSFLPDCKASLPRRQKVICMNL